jgi:SNF2 family DNA or RNA helicase
MQQITGGFVAVDDEGSDVSRLRDIGDSRRAALEEILEDIGADEPVVVFCRFWRDIDNVGLASQKVSGRRALELSGRKKELDEWQKPDAPPVLAVQIQTGGLGVDLTRACYCVYYSIGYSLGDLEQAKARTHRPGQTRPVTHIQMIARGTIDSMIWRAIDEKRDVIESILGEVR